MTLDVATRKTQTGPNAVDTTPEGWRRIVRLHSNRDLTYPTDRLPALSGIASIYTEQNSTDHLADLWQDHIHHDLSWFRVLRVEETECEVGIQILKTYWTPTSQKPLHNGAPSWTWASIREEIAWAEYYNPIRKLRSGETYPIRSRIMLLRAHCPPAAVNTQCSVARCFSSDQRTSRGGNLERRWVWQRLHKPTRSDAKLDRFGLPHHVYKTT